MKSPAGGGLRRPGSRDQLVDAFLRFDIELPEQVIDVPKIILEDIPMRALVRGSKLAEVPMPEKLVLASGTDVSWVSWCQVVACELWPRPVDSPGWVHRQPRVVHKYWARVMWSTFL